MDLILWRHAEAEDGLPGAPDAGRELTARGRKQAMKMAGWLDHNLLRCWNRSEDRAHQPRHSA